MSEDPAFLILSMLRTAITRTLRRMSAVARPIYMDLQATTPLDPRVLDSMMPYLTEKFGNPHSRTHVYGWETEEGIEVARKQIADLIGADAKEIIFTSGMFLPRGLFILRMTSPCLA